MANANLNILFQAQDNGLSNYISNLTSLLGGASGDVSRLFGAFAGSVGAVGYISSAINAFKNFNSQLARAGAVSNATESELRTLASTALELGRVTEYTATDAANAMNELALAGFSVNEIVAATPGLLAMATSGAMNIGRTAGIASQALRSFHIEADKMNYISGVLTATFSSTNTRLSDLDYTIKYAGASAAELGTRLSEVAAAAGILGNVGIKGSMSGTGLRQMMDQLASSLGGNTDQLARSAKALQQLGIEWSSVTDEFGNLSIVKAVDALEQSFDKMGMTAEQRIKMLRPIFGIRASSQVTALVGQGAEVLRAKEMEVAFGGAKQMLMGFIQQATALPDGIRGLKLDSVELADNFVTVGEVGTNNLSRISAQMRELGLVGGLLNTQVGLTRDRVQKLDGKVIRSQVFTPMEELNAGTLRTIDALIRLKEHINSTASEGERLAILQDIFGADARMMEMAKKAFSEGGSAMQEFANQLLRANSALDVQKKQLDTLWGSLELLSSALDTIQTNVGELMAPVIRVIALAGSAASGLLLQGNTITSQLAEFQENLGGIEKHIYAIRDAWNKFSPVGQAAALLTIMLAFTSTLAMVVPMFAAWVGSLISFLGTLTGILNVVSGGGAMLGALLLPIGAIIGGIIGRTASANEEFQEIGDTIRAISGSILIARNDFANFLGLTGNALSAFNNIRIYVYQALEAFNFLGDAAYGLNNIIGRIGGNQPLTRYLANATDALADFINGWRGVVTGASTGERIVGAFGGHTGAIIDGILEGVMTIEAAATNMFGAFLNSLGQIFNLNNLFWSSLIFAALDTLPTIWELVKGIYRSFHDLGSLKVMPQVTIKMAYEAGPSGGLLTSFMRELKSGANGMIWLATLITETIIRLANVIVENLVSAIAAIIGLTLNLIAGLPKAIFSLITGLYEVTENLIRATVSLISTSITTIASWTIQIIYLAVETLVGMIITTIITLANTIVESIQALIMTFPTMIINTILKIYAAVINFLGRIALAYFNLASIILTHLLRTTRRIITAIIDVVVVIATLPISLPYLAMLAVRGFVATFIEKLSPGFGAIKTALQTILNGMVAIAKEIWKELVGVILSPLRNIVYTVSNIFMSLVSLPFVVGGIFVMIYQTITGVTERVFNYIADTLWTIPDMIESMVYRVFGLLRGIADIVTNVFSAIFFTIVDEVMRGVNLVLRFLLGFFVYLPITIIRSVLMAARAILVGINNLVVNIFLNIQYIIVRLVNKFITDIVLKIRNAYAWMAYGITSLIEVLRDLSKRVLQAAVDGVTYIFVTIPDTITSAIGQLIDFINNEIMNAPQLIGDLAVSLIEGTVETIRASISSAGSIFEQVLTKEFPEAIFESIVTLINTINALPARFYAAVITQFDRINAAIVKAVQNLGEVDWDNISNKIKESAEHVASRIKAGIERIFALLANLPGNIIRAFQIIDRTVRNWATYFAENILPIIQNSAIQIATAARDAIWGLVAVARNTWRRFWEEISLAFGTTDVGEIVLIFLFRIYGAITRWADSVQGSIARLFGDVSASPALRLIRDGLLGLFDMIRAGAQWAAVGMAIFVRRFGDIRDALARFFIGGLGVVGAAAAAGIGVLAQIGTLLWNLGAAAFSAVTAVGDAISLALETVGDQDSFEDAFNMVFNILREYANNGGQMLLDLISALVTRILNTLWNIISALVYRVFTNFIGMLWNSGSLIGQALAVIGGAMGLVAWIIIRISSFIGRMLAPVFVLLGGVLTGLYNIVTGLAAGFSQALEDLLGWFNDVFLGFNEFGGGVMEWFDNFLTVGLGETIKNAISNTLASVKDWVSNSTIGRWFGGNDEAGGEAGEGTAGGGFNDFVMRPGQAPATFSPNDTIFGVKDPAKLRGAAGVGGGASGFTSAVSGFSASMRSLSFGFTELAGSLNQSGKKTATLTDSITGLIRSVPRIGEKASDGFITQLRATLGSMPKMGEGMSALYAKLGLGTGGEKTKAESGSAIGAGVMGVERSLVGLYAAVKTGPGILDIAADTWEGVKYSVFGIFKKIEAPTAEYASGVSQRVGAMLQKSKTLLGAPTVATEAAGTLEKIKGPVDKVKAALEGFSVELPQKKILEQAQPTIIKTYGDISNSVKGVKVGLPQNWGVSTKVGESPVLTGTKGIWTRFVDFMKNGLQQIKDTASGFWNSLRNGFQNILSLDFKSSFASWKNLFSTFTGEAGTVFRGLFEHAKGLLSSIWGYLRSFVGGIGGIFSWIWKLVVNIFTGGSGAAITQVKGLWTVIVDGVMFVVRVLIVPVFTLIKGAVLFLAGLAVKLSFVLGMVALKLLAFLGPIILTQLAIEAVIWALDQLAKAATGMSLWDLIITGLTEAWRLTVEFFAYLWTVMKPVFAFIAAASIFLWNLFKMLIARVYAGLKLFLSIVIGEIRIAIALTAAAIRIVWAVVQPLLSILIGMLGTFLRGLFSLVYNIISLIIKNKNLLYTILAVTAVILASLYGPIAIIAAVLFGLLAYLLRNLDLSEEGIKELFKNMGKWIDETLEGAQALADEVNGAVQEALEKIGMATDIIIDSLENVWNKVVVYIADFGDELEDCFGFIIEWFLDKLREIPGMAALLPKNPDPMDAFVEQNLKTSKRLPAEELEARQPPLLLAIEKMKNSINNLQGQQQQQAMAAAGSGELVPAVGPLIGLIKVAAGYENNMDNIKSISDNIALQQRQLEGYRKSLEDVRTELAQKRASGQNPQTNDEQTNDEGTKSKSSQGVSADASISITNNYNIEATAHGIAPTNMGNSNADMIKNMLQSGINLPTTIGPQGLGTNNPQSYRNFISDKSAKARVK